MSGPPPPPPPPMPPMGSAVLAPIGPANGWITQLLISKACDASAIYDNTKEYGFGWWFAYFWKEVGARSRNENLLKEVLATVFANSFPADIATKSASAMRAAGNTVADGFTSLLPEPPDLMTRPTHYRTMLTKLLNVGFREMPTLPANQIGPMAPGKEMFADRIGALKNNGRVPVAIAYRGETRDYDTVIKHKGALSRADLGLLNMNQPWHPFSDPVVAGKTYARGASGDNCLFTVLSVGSDVRIPVGFPLIEDKNIYTLSALPATEPVKNLSKWNYKMFRDSQGKTPVLLARCAVSNVGRTFGIFLATDSFIYAVKVKTAIFTQDFVETQFAMARDQCKERGVRDVRLKDFLAGARVRRIHLGPARMCGVIGFVQEVKYFIDGEWTAVPDANKFAGSHFYGDLSAARQALGMIRRQFTGPAGNEIIKGEVNAAMAPNPMPTVQRIEQWDLTFEQFKSLRDNQGAQLYYGPTA